MKHLLVIFTNYASHPPILFLTKFVAIFDQYINRFSTINSSIFFCILRIHHTENSVKEYSNNNQRGKVTVSNTNNTYLSLSSSL